MESVTRNTTINDMVMSREEAEKDVDKCEAVDGNLATKYPPAWYEKHCAAEAEYWGKPCEQYMCVESAIMPCLWTGLPFLFTLGKGSYPVFPTKGFAVPVEDPKPVLMSDMGDTNQTMRNIRDINLFAGNIFTDANNGVEMPDYCIMSRPSERDLEWICEWGRLFDTEEEARAFANSSECRVTGDVYMYDAAKLSVAAKAIPPTDGWVKIVSR